MLWRISLARALLQVNQLRALAVWNSIWSRCPDSCMPPNQKWFWILTGLVDQVPALVDGAVPLARCAGRLAGPLAFAGFGGLEVPDLGLGEGQDFITEPGELVVLAEKGFAGDLAARLAVAGTDQPQQPGRVGGPGVAAERRAQHLLNRFPAGQRLAGTLSISQYRWMPRPL